MVNCTSREVFSVALDNIGPGKGEVIVVVIENFLCEAARDIIDLEEKKQGP
jgi:microcompartment protein CcmK/EutM